MGRISLLHSLLDFLLIRCPFRKAFGVAYASEFDVERIQVAYVFKGSLPWYSGP